MIGIFASQEEDFKVLLAKATIIHVECFAKGKIMEARLNRKKILFVSTGYNKVNLGLVAGYVVGKYQMDALIGVGNCGYIGNGPLKLGDIAIAHSTVEYSVDSTALGYPDTVIPGVGLGTFPCAGKLVKLAEEACRKLNYCHLTGKVATAETFVADVGERNLIATKYTSQFIDMECGGSGQIAYIHHLPCVFVKGVSNFADHCAASDYEQYLGNANAKANEVVYEMLQCLMDRDDLSCSVNLSEFRALNECEIRAVIAASSHVNLGVSENNQPYVVPMCFDANPCHLDVITLYSQETGRKMTCMENNEKVVLEFMMDTQHGYKSVVAFGNATIEHESVWDMCNENLVRIVVRIDALSGREYMKCR